MDLFGCLDWKQPRDLWRTSPHQRLFDFRRTVLINLPPNWCMNHMHTSNLILVSAECSGSRQMARNSSKFTTNMAMRQGWRWVTLEEVTTTNSEVKLSLYHCRILLTDSCSWKRSILMKEGHSPKREKNCENNREGKKEPGVNINRSCWFSPLQCSTVTTQSLPAAPPAAPAQEFMALQGSLWCHPWHILCTHRPLWSPCIHILNFTELLFFPEVCSMLMHSAFWPSLPLCSLSLPNSLNSL